MKDFAISLKGGMSFGFGAIGLIRFLQENNLQPKIIAGSSSGAMVAALYAYGKTWQEMYEIVKDVNFWNLVTVKAIVRGGSMVDLDRYRSKISSIEGDFNIEDLQKKLIIFVTDPIENRRLLIEKGSVVDAILASSGYPPIFPAVTLKGFYGRPLIDGDFTVGYSSSTLKSKGVDKVIGISFQDPTKYRKKLRGTFLERARMVTQLLSIQIEKHNDGNDRPDVEIKFPVEKYSRFSFKDVYKIIENGYRETLQHKEEIFKALEV